MLKRIRVRGKLFLLLTTPLVALLLFAYLGVIDRFDDFSEQGREEQIADLADAGSDLSLTLAQERLTGMLIDAGADLDLAPVAAANNDAMRRWLGSAQVVRPNISDRATLREMESLTSQLSARIAGGGSADRSTTALLAELSLMSRSIDSINGGLVAEAGDLDLYRAMFVQGFAGEMQIAATELTIVGSNSLRSGEVSTVSGGILDRADGRLAVAATEFQDQVDTRYQLAMSELRNKDLIPRVADGRYDTTAELEGIIASGDSAAMIEWLTFGLARIEGIHGLSDLLLEDASTTAATRATAARQSAQNFIILAGSVTAVAVLMAVVIGRSISGPLTRLSRHAQQLSSEELPALVESMRTGARIAPPEITVIKAKGRDEVAQLSTAISEIQRVTIEVAEEQSELLHRGISEMFINLARRNQGLLDRQIEFIDQLESSEEDPDQLENLFRLDHLATRMRRNAESLLVLAGGEPSRRRGEPVEIDAVSRVAVSEIEEYARVDLRSIEVARIPSTVAVDLAHLLSELMENAAQFSPPDSKVEVIGQIGTDGRYRITVVDRGMGMTVDQLAVANSTLAEPPVLGLDMGRSLGFTVVSLIASRLEMKVRLTPTPNGGVTAVVSIPSSLLVAASVQEPKQIDTSSEAIPEADGDLFGVFGSTPPAVSPSTSDDGDLFRDVAPATDPPTPTPPSIPASAVSNLPPPPALLPTIEAPTGGTLPRRRQATTAPVSLSPPAVAPTASASSSTSAGLTRRVAKEPSEPPEPTVAEATSNTRSPEEVREMLSRYRGGLKRGRVPGNTDEQNDQS